MYLVQQYGKVRSENNWWYATHFSNRGILKDKILGIGYPTQKFEYMLQFIKAKWNLYSFIGYH